MNPPVDGTATATHIVVEYTIEEDCEEPAESLSGRWGGMYTCVSRCEGNPEPYEEGGSVELTITQDDRQASYVDDGGATYQGTVCGPRFTFSGGLEHRIETMDDSYSESGRFTLQPDGTATKVSEYSSILCQGRCDDVLERLE